jgi:hypothetical protein
VGYANLHHTRRQFRQLVPQLLIAGALFAVAVTAFAYCASPGSAPRSSQRQPAHSHPDRRPMPCRFEPRHSGPAPATRQPNGACRPGPGSAESPRH